jgi:hypothetical protein
MYTKVFRSIYEGTLSDDWQALVTFQQLLILSDQNGVVDMTLAAIQRTTGIPLDILKHGMEALEQPDPQSRSRDMDGRRIARLDAHRDWGWFIVNFQTYRELQEREDKRKADRERIAAKRAASSQKVASPSDVSPDVAASGSPSASASQVQPCREESPPVASCRALSPSVATVANVAHTDTDTDTEAGEELSSSLRSDSSPAAPATAPVATLEPRAAQRLAIVTDEAIAAWNASRLVKSNGGNLPAVSATVGREKRQQQVKRCLRTARDICADRFNTSTVTPEFWVAYFEEAARDDFHAGRRSGGRGHENWLPDFEYLTREATMLKLFERAASDEVA